MVRILLVFLFLLAMGAASGPAQAEEGALVFGIHPLLSSAELVKRFTPLLDRLTLALGQPVRLRIAEDYDQHIQAIGQDELDLAYLGPSLYLQMVEHHGLKPILARLELDGRSTFRGVIFTRRESPIHQLAELRGKRFAFGDRSATMSHLVPRHMLLQAGIRVEELAAHPFLGNHQNITLAVLMGQFDAGAVKEDIFYQYESRGLRALAYSPPISNHVLVARRDLPAERIALLRQVLHHLREEPDGPAILRAIDPAASGFTAGADEDFAYLRVLTKELKEAESGP